MQLQDSQGIWTITSLAGHECHIFEPAVASDHAYVVLYLHGLQLIPLHDHSAFSHQFDMHGLRVICPVARGSWWTDRVCPQFDSQITAERFVTDRVVPYISERWDSRPPQIGLLGTSMGGQGSLRLAYKYPDTFPVVAALAPAIDYHQLMEANEDETLPLMYDDPEEARQDTALLHVHPLNWPRHQFFCCDPTDQRWWNSSDRLQMKLSSLGIPHECDLETVAGGHGFAYYNSMAERAVRFLAERLKQERLRIPHG